MPARLMSQERWRSSTPGLGTTTAPQSMAYRLTGPQLAGRRVQNGMPPQGETQALVPTF